SSALRRVVTVFRRRATPGACGWTWERAVALLPAPYGVRLWGSVAYEVEYFEAPGGISVREHDDCVAAARIDPEVRALARGASGVANETAAVGQAPTIVIPGQAAVQERHPACGEDLEVFGAQELVGHQGVGEFQKVPDRRIGTSGRAATELHVPIAVDRAVFLQAATRDGFQSAVDVRVRNSAGRQIDVFRLKPAGGHAGRTEDVGLNVSIVGQAADDLHDAAQDHEAVVAVVAL